MRILLDTCTFLWVCLASDEFSSTAQQLYFEAEEVYLSPVSSWEIAVKFRLGKLNLPEDPGTWVPRQRIAHGIETLPLQETATLAILKLPDLHKDPFDRMLICQAMYEGLVLLTPDPLIRAYPIRTQW